MNLEEFERLLDRHGTNLDAWPDPIRARALLERSQQARAAHDTAARVEQVLHPHDHTAPAYLRTRILANLPSRSSVETFVGWLGDSFWRVAATAALPLMLGFGAGIFSDSQDTEVAAVDTLVYIENLEEFSFNEF